MRYQLLAFIAVGAFGFAGAARADGQPPETLPEDEAQPVPPPASTAPQAVPEQSSSHTTVIINPPPQQQPEALPPEQHHARRHRRSKVFSPYETSLLIGGGGSGYIFHQMIDVTSPGAAWDVRLTVGTRSFIAVEAGYLGTYNKLESNGPAPYIINHSVDGDFRFNLIPWRVEPYVFGGIGYNHSELRNPGQNPLMASRFFDDANQVYIPAGGGLSAYLFTHGTIDARFTYRAILNNELMRSLRDGEGREDQWVVTGRFGYAF
jgi:hypothetical protein